MVGERAWDLESEDRISAFLLVFDLVQDNYYCLHNHHSDYLISAYFVAGIMQRIVYTGASPQP